MTVTVDNTDYPVVFVGCPGEGYRKAKVPMVYPSGVSANNFSALTITYNKRNCTLQVRCPGTCGFLRLLDITGNLIQGPIPMCNSKRISLSNLAHGCYLVELRSDNQVKYMKIVH